MNQHQSSTETGRSTDGVCIFVRWCYTPLQHPNDKQTFAGQKNVKTHIRKAVPGLHPTRHSSSHRAWRQLIGPIPAEKHRGPEHHQSKYHSERTGREYQCQLRQSCCFEKTRAEHQPVAVPARLSKPYVKPLERQPAHLLATQRANHHHDPRWNPG